MNITDEMLSAAIKAYRGDNVAPDYMKESMKLAILAALTLYVSSNEMCEHCDFDYEKCCAV